MRAENKNRKEEESDSAFWIKAGWPGYRPIMCCWQSFSIPKAFGNHKCINWFATGGLFVMI
jgi:hypothetical protein